LQRPDREDIRGVIRATGRDTIDYKASLLLSNGRWLIDPTAPQQGDPPGAKDIKKPLPPITRAQIEAIL
jgi:hypothetical protein